MYERRSTRTRRGARTPVSTNGQECSHGSTVHEEPHWLIGGFGHGVNASHLFLNVNGLATAPTHKEPELLLVPLSLSVLLLVGSISPRMFFSKPSRASSSVFSPLFNNSDRGVTLRGICIQLALFKATLVVAIHRVARIATKPFGAHRAPSNKWCFQGVCPRKFAAAPSAVNTGRSSANKAEAAVWATARFREQTRAGDWFVIVITARLYSVPHEGATTLPLLVRGRDRRFSAIAHVSKVIAPVTHECSAI